RLHPTVHRSGRERVRAVRGPGLHHDLAHQRSRPRGDVGRRAAERSVETQPPSPARPEGRFGWDAVGARSVRRPEGLTTARYVGLRAWPAPCRMSSPSASSTRTTWTVAAIVAYLAMVTMNALANLLPLFGRATGDVSDSYPSLFTPAPFTFGVW